MIADYVYDALAGQDKPYAAQLLSRRASLSFRLNYYFIKLKIAACHSAGRIFDETMTNSRMSRACRTYRFYSST
jgi:hypothetical protein